MKTRVWSVASLALTVLFSSCRVFGVEPVAKSTPSASSPRARATRSSRPPAPVPWTPARNLAAKMGVQVDVQWRTPNNEDAQQQAKFIEEPTASGVDGIAVSCSDAKVLTAAINAAVDKGVEVVTFDSDAPDSKRLRLLRHRRCRGRPRRRPRACESHG